MELAPRDMVSRAEMTEILEGRAFQVEGGLEYLELDLTHLGVEKINKRLPLIRELCMKFVGLDPVDKPIPIRPVAHYSMGGIETDIRGASRVPGIWAAGEVACVSLHGANRLGANSTAECLAWGGLAGGAIASALGSLPPPAPLPAEALRASELRLAELLRREGRESLYALRRELRNRMDRDVGVFRTEPGLGGALEAVRAIRERSRYAPVADKSHVYNTNLFHALELQHLLDLAEVAVAGALARSESRGAHARRDFPSRDDGGWLRHTLAWRADAGPRIEYKPVTIDTWTPVERKY
jgi:succinate dehydrogenase / fumarate reductase flavoprotein subunit